MTIEYRNAVPCSIIKVHDGTILQRDGRAAFTTVTECYAVISHFCTDTDSRRAVLEDVYLSFSEVGNVAYDRLVTYRWPCCRSVGSWCN